MIDTYNYIKFTTYRKIFSKLFEKRFISKSGINKLLNVNSNKNFNILLNAKIIRPSKLTKKEKKYILTLNGMNEHNLNLMKIYRFTKQGLKAFSEHKEEILKK